MSFAYRAMVCLLLASASCASALAQADPLITGQLKAQPATAQPLGASAGTLQLSARLRPALEQPKAASLVVSGRLKAAQGGSCAAPTDELFSNGFE